MRCLYTFKLLMKILLYTIKYHKIQYLRNLINDHEAPMKLIDYETSMNGEWKIQIKMPIKFISSKNFEETRTVHSVSNNVEIMMGSETDDISEGLFESVLQRYQKAKEESKKRGSKFVFESVDLLYYYFHKISLKRDKP